MKAVIMAGGRGTRLRPLTCYLPKPMVPLLDRPCMEYIVDLLVAHGIPDIAVTVQYMPQVIRTHFGDGTEFGVSMRIYEEAQPLGTAGSVKNVEPWLDDTFIVISGDAMTILIWRRSYASTSARERSPRSFSHASRRRSNMAS